MKEQFEQLIMQMRALGLTPMRERSLRKQFAQAELMAYLRRPEGNSDADAIADLVAEAEARLKKPFRGGAPIEPMRPETWQTAMLVTRKAQRVLKEDTKRARLRKHNTAQKPAPRYFKCGHKLINKISRAQAAKFKWEMDVTYAS